MHSHRPATGAAHARRSPAAGRVAVVLAVLVAGACGATAPSTSASSSSVAPTAPMTTIAAPSVGHVGTTIALPATDQNVPAVVTLLQVVDPATGADQFSTPNVGDRFVGVQLRVVFSGPGPVQVDLNGGTTVYDTLGQQYPATTATIKNCRALPSGTLVAAGKPAVGCVTVALPMTSVVAKVTFTPGSQFGGSTATWQVP